MKTWQILVLGVFIGLAATGIIIVVTSQPRGEPIRLLPKPTARPLVVNVTGSVTNPGVYSLAPESRIQDAIKAAGGATPDGDLSSINLAAWVVDAQNIVIPTFHQTEADKSTSIEANPASPTFPININRASVEELDSLPGIGKTKAEAIIAYRTQYGEFRSLTDLQNVSGIGPAIYDQIKDLITITN